MKRIVTNGRHISVSNDDNERNVLPLEKVVAALSQRAKDALGLKKTISSGSLLLFVARIVFVVLTHHAQTMRM